MQVIRVHRLEREADYAAQREHEWEQALAEEAQRHKSVPNPECCSDVSHLMHSLRLVRSKYHQCWLMLQPLVVIMYVQWHALPSLAGMS